MNKLLIKPDDALEYQRLTDALDLAHIYPAALARAYRDEAARLISALFRVLHAVQIGVGGEGDWWFAEAEIRRDDRTYFLSVESSNPVGALSALIVEIVKDDNRRLD